METLSELPARCEWNHPGPRFNIKMSSYQYRKSHCGDKTVVRLSYLHNGISYTGKMTSLYWFSPLVNMLKAKSILYTLIDSLCTLWSHSIMHELKTRNLIDIFSIERDFIVKNSEIVSKLLKLKRPNHKWYDFKLQSHKLFTACTKSVKRPTFHNPQHICAEP